MKLTKEQERVLREMASGVEKEGDFERKDCAYRLETTMNTMYALLKRDLIKRTNYNEVVWYGWESTGYEFKITDLGRKVIGETKNAE